MKQFWFIGVTTGQSMIMRLFPIWAEVLGIQETRMHGVDLPPGVEGIKVRETILELRDNPGVLGALVTTHKLAVWEEASDLFAEVDEHAKGFRKSAASPKTGMANWLVMQKIRSLPARRWDSSSKRIIGRLIPKPRLWFWGVVVPELPSSNSCFPGRMGKLLKKSPDWNTTKEDWKSSETIFPMQKI